MEKLFSELENKGVTNRVTWIDADGRVLFDNVAEAKDMDNHLDRPEITEALKNGLVSQFIFLKLWAVKHIIMLYGLIMARFLGYLLRQIVFISLS